MAVGCTIQPNNTVLPEQILTYFKIDIDDTNKCICPFHDETMPSMQVNKDYVYCYGCGWAGDTWRLASTLLSQTGFENYDIIRFLTSTPFPSPSGRVYKTTSYRGGVERNLVEYWHNCLLTNTIAYSRLIKERGLTGSTVQKFKLGWRPDKKAYVIPYMYHGEVDIVQFRATDTDESGRKYWGLEGHNRGSLVNRDILDKPLPYVVILMGAFDPILAHQDGIFAVGMNGSFPFKKTEQERVQEMFAKQTIKFIVPDKNDEELKAATKLARWIDGDVRVFPEYVPHNTDYIDYRLSLGYTVSDFKRDVLRISPDVDYTDTPLFENLCSLYDTGDVHSLASVHCNKYAKGSTYSDVALALANNHVTTAIERRIFYNVLCEEDFNRAMKLGYRIKGGW